ncbi:MAG: hypothetical protein LBB75_10180 [Oscillospiraceae bacterium]|jgi:hypothetical protein|nr:hypothetical protein [Oscillospiraceae bacterium]
MTKLLLIEGIPGAGKTTIAAKAARHCEGAGRRVKLYPEGCEKWPNLRRTNPGLYEGQSSDKAFFKWHGACWRMFSAGTARRDTLHVFESALLQLHLNEMLLWRDTDEETMLAHCARLGGTVRQLSPVLIYLSPPDIRRIAEERVHPGGARWIDWVINYIENSAYGRRNGARGFGGAAEYFALRKALELKALNRLGLPYAIIDNPEYDWDDVWTKIEAFLRENNIKGERT